MIRIIIMICLLPFFGATALADCMDFTNPLLHTYQIDIDGQQFEMAFNADSMVDCPSGTSTISYTIERDGWIRDFEIITEFTTNDDIILIDGLGYGFITASDNLYIIPSETSILKMDQVIESIKFPW